MKYKNLTKSTASKVQAIAINQPRKNISKWE